MNGLILIKALGTFSGDKETETVTRVLLKDATEELFRARKELPGKKKTIRRKNK